MKKILLILFLFYILILNNNTVFATPSAEEMAVRTRQFEQTERLYGIKASLLKDYYLNGWRWEELSEGLFVYYATHKPFDDIMSMRKTNSWARIRYLLHITPNDEKFILNNLLIDGTNLTKKLDMDKSAILNLTKQNYDIGTIFLAARYAQYAHRPLNDIISLFNYTPPKRNIYNIANDLQISEKDLNIILSEYEHLLDDVL